MIETEDIDLSDDRFIFGFDSSVRRKNMSDGAVKTLTASDSSTSIILSSSDRDFFRGFADKEGLGLRIASTSTERDARMLVL
mmetsp:Transcript_8125/g.14754  ORF Transcript_8125/g.14754 Transcript_8125/m.14754 type:complete len:82 (-) Transcript_8125:444-689(-)